MDDNTILKISIGVIISIILLVGGIGGYALYSSIHFRISDNTSPTSTEAQNLTSLKCYKSDNSNSEYINYMDYELIYNNGNLYQLIVNLDYESNLYKNISSTRSYINTLYNNYNSYDGIIAEKTNTDKGAKLKITFDLNNTMALSRANYNFLYKNIFNDRNNLKSYLINDKGFNCE